MWGVGWRGGGVGGRQPSCHLASEHRGSKVLRQEEAGTSVGQAMDSREGGGGCEGGWDRKVAGQGPAGHPEVAFIIEGIGGFCTLCGFVWRTQWTGAERGLVFLLGWTRAYPSL